MKGNESRKPTPKEPGLTRKQETAIAALLSHSTMKEAATAAKVGESTLWRWLQEDDFHAAYMTARRETVKQAIAQLQNTTSEAVAVLKEVMSNKNANDFARISAAKAIIEYSIKAVEIEDLAQRVEDLESVMAATAKPQVMK
jgi:hypothetical protein